MERTVALRVEDSPSEGVVLEAHPRKQLWRVRLDSGEGTTVRRGHLIAALAGEPPKKVGQTIDLEDPLLPPINSFWGVQ